MLTLAFGLPGTTEWIIILIIALLIFGSRLPKVMRSMGQSVNQFKRGMNEMIDEDQRQEDEANAEKEEEAKA
jgi:sec-independent protein translocase protein TatA